eukprot:CAMPEP_0118642426 /NCGR_PEP_ID=MMETSP0785-20121206/5827_1 /TAXON_ID=91992 /ORGANISM="Bolidomonas pacifica, Strain CCMP 1866" /LENGTH=499 /DNA_ID=CAMNT_0006533973 /DNA_START=1 /DNA_END=1497 /DNA_ORIENTATION=-
MAIAVSYPSKSPSKQSRWAMEHKLEHTRTQRTYQSSYRTSRTYLSTISSPDDATYSDSYSNSSSASSAGSSQSDEPSSPTPYYTLPTPTSLNPSCERGIVIVDAFSPSHLLYMKRRALKTYNAGVVECYSPKVTRYLMTRTSDSREKNSILSRSMPASRSECSTWASSIPFEIVGVVCESDGGGSVAELMTEWLDLDGERGNSRMSARRDKYLMHKVIKDTKVKGTAKCYVCDNVPDAVVKAEGLGVMDQDDEGVLVYEERKPCIVKPRRGVASDRVFKCTTLQEVAEAAEHIIGSTAFGDDRVIEDCMVMEYLKGLEVAVDTVTRNGETKVVAVWEYDKRPANDAPFVNFATRLVDGAFHPPPTIDDDPPPLPPLNSTSIPSSPSVEGSKASGNRTSSTSTDSSNLPKSLSLLPSQARYVVVKKVCDYVQTVLQSLEYNWGMAHTEVKVTMNRNFLKSGYSSGDVGVRLIEVNPRQNNAEFAPLAQGCVGYNKIDVCA